MGHTRMDFPRTHCESLTKPELKGGAPGPASWQPKALKGYKSLPDS